VAYVRQYSTSMKHFKISCILSKEELGKELRRGGMREGMDINWLSILIEPQI